MAGRVRGPPRPTTRKHVGNPITTAPKRMSRAKRTKARLKGIKRRDINQPKPPTKPLKRPRIKLTRSERNKRRLAILGTGKPRKRPGFYFTPGTRPSRGKARGARRALPGLAITSSGRLIPVEEKISRASTASQKSRLTENDKRSAEYYTKKKARQEANRLEARQRAAAKEKRNREIREREEAAKERRLLLEQREKNRDWLR